jgi:GXWXG protein/Domain of unknown function (DUF4334)
MAVDLQSRLTELEARADRTQAMEFYDSLPAATIDQMIGGWRGGGLTTGHVFDGLLQQFGWHGKRFDSPEDAHPLVFRRGNGKLFSINPSRIPISMLIRHIDLARSNAAAGLFGRCSWIFSTDKPQARLRMTRYRGVVSATMIYDALPINDIFRAVGPDTLVGAMDMRGFEHPFMFLLRREAPAAIAF